MHDRRHIGSMIIAMIARVALGRSGRPLIPHPLDEAGLLHRCYWPLLRSVVWPIGGRCHFMCSRRCFWVAGFAIYVALYTQIVTTPRPDGRIG